MTNYIATEDIFVGPHVRAFRKGDVVPESVIENLGVQDKVASERTKAATAAKADAAKAPAPTP